MKKIVPLMLILIFFFSMQSNVGAAGQAQVYELLIGNGIKYKGPYYKDQGDFDAIRFDIGGNEAVSVTITSWADETFTKPLTTKSFKASDYGFSHFTAMGFNCNAHYTGVAKEFDDDIVLSVKMTVSGLEKPKCDSEPTGDLFEENDLGDGDGSGGNGDGSGGDGDGSGGDGDGSGGDGDGSGGNGDGSGGDGDGGACESCQIFNCPGWDDYMGKLNDIKNAIPPAPDWHKVSKIFSDAIVPRLVSETRDMLDELLGRAPDPPPTLPDLPQLDDHNFDQSIPEMQDVPGLDGFDANDIKNSSPDIQFEEDPSGGFDLSVDPVNNLPDVVPGGDPGAYKRDPKELPATYPGAPKDTQIDMGGAPTPSDGGGTPPVPEDSAGTPPKPNDGVQLPGNPKDVSIPGKEYYMPVPGGD